MIDIFYFNSLSLCRSILAHTFLTGKGSQFEFQSINGFYTLLMPFYLCTRVHAGGLFNMLLSVTCQVGRFDD